MEVKVQISTFLEDLHCQPLERFKRMGKTRGICTFMKIVRCCDDNLYAGGPLLFRFYLTRAIVCLCGFLQLCSIML